MTDINSLLANVNLNNLFSNKEFWIEYFEPWGNRGEYLIRYFQLDEDEVYEDDEIYSLKIELPFPADFKIYLEMLLIGIQDELSLEFLVNQQDAPAIQDLGWDGGNFMYSALRWEETEAIVEYFRIENSSLGFDPSFVPLLLRKFTPATTRNYDLVYRETENYLRQSNLFSEDDIKTISNKISFVQQDLDWIYRPKDGWVAIGEDGYSLRYDDFSNNFNFSAFREFMKTVYTRIGKFDVDV